MNNFAFTFNQLIFIGFIFLSFVKVKDKDVKKESLTDIISILERK